MTVPHSEGKGGVNDAPTPLTPAEWEAARIAAELRAAAIWSMS